MTYKILILKNAEDDLAWFRKHDRKSYIKCFDLVRALMENPSCSYEGRQRKRIFRDPPSFPVPSIRKGNGRFETRLEQSV